MSTAENVPATPQMEAFLARFDLPPDPQPVEPSVLKNKDVVAVELTHREENGEVRSLGDIEMGMVVLIGSATAKQSVHINNRIRSAIGKSQLTLVVPTIPHTLIERPPGEWPVARQVLPRFYLISSHVSVEE